MNITNIQVDTMKDELLNQMQYIIDTQDYLLEQEEVIRNKILDIDHEIELSSDKDIIRGYKMYKLLRDVRRERRIVKDRLEEIKPLVKLVNESVFMSNKNKINQVCENIETIIEKNVNADVRKAYRVREMRNEFGDTIYKTHGVVVK